VFGLVKSQLEKSMSQNKNDNKGQDSGFGGSMFGGNGGAGGTNAGGGNSQFGGDFQGGFGGTNAVSQIFKDGGSGGGDDKKKRMIMIAAVGVTVAAVAAGGWFLFFDDAAPSAETTEVAPTAPVVPPAESAETAAVEEATDDTEEAVEEDTAAPATSAPAQANEDTEVIGSSNYTYNEEKGGPVIKSTAGANIQVSRAESFSPLYVTGKANADGKFQIPNPPPGEIFWRVSGSNAATKITIKPPPSLTFDFSAPAEVAAGGTLGWSATGPAAFFRLEVSTDQSFANLAAVVSTKENQAALNNIAAGRYYVRLGGFNKASGKWEYSNASQTNVK
jgi:hypothetical protein